MNFFRSEISKGEFSKSNGKRLIEPPSRTTAAGTIIICSVLAVLSLVMITPHYADLWAVGEMALLTVAAMLLCLAQAAHLALFSLLLITLPLLISAFRPWPFNLLVPILIYGLSVFAVPFLRCSIGWLRRGLLGADIVRLVLASILISGVALVVWYLTAQPAIRQYLKYMPQIPLWVLPFAGLGFSLVNAAMEEAIFRGIMMEALESALGQGGLAIVLQAASFALLHYVTGFPYGVWGFAMTFVYGLMLGAIRRRAAGMLAPWLAHVGADMTIFIILATIVLS